MDNDLTKLLEPLKGNPLNEIKTREIIEVYNGENLMATVFPHQRYVKFHGEFQQLAGTIDELKPFIQELDRQGYDSNYA